MGTLCEGEFPDCLLVVYRCTRLYKFASSSSLAWPLVTPVHYEQTVRDAV